MNDPQGAAPIAVIDGLREVAPRFDLVLCDIWGVLHDGLKAFATAAEALARFRAEPGADRPRRVVLLTNAPRPWDSVQRQLDGFGVSRGAYDAIVSSGDLTRALVAERSDAVVHHLGPDRDKPIFEGLSPRMGAIDEASYVVCTGLLDDDRETVADYAETLRRMRERDLLMVCANPDLVVERGRDLVPCAGSLAAAYEVLGGEVIWAGKPHAPVYDRVMGVAADLDGGRPHERARVLAIGDALRTDIAGARAYGVPSLFVARGIHAGEMDGGAAEGRPERIAAWLATQPVRPDIVIGDLVWEPA